MRSVLFILAALVSLIYAADPVGTWTSPCMGPLPFPNSPTDLYIGETVTLSDGMQFQNEQIFYIDACKTPMIIARLQGTFETTGDETGIDPTNPTTPITVQGIDVHRSNYFITVLDSTVSPIIQTTCGLSFTPTKGVAFDIHTSGCTGLGILPNSTCPTFQDIYNVDGANLQIGAQFLNVSTCFSRQQILNPTPFTPLSAPTLSSGNYELGCTLFDTTTNLYNTYYLQITADAGGNTGKYSLTSNTFQGATCAQSALFSTTVLSATYTLDGYGVVQNDMLDAGRPIQLNLVFSSKKVTPNNNVAATVLQSSFCTGSTFTAGQATELNTVGCALLGFPPNSLCQSKHFDVAQVALDGSGFYPGGATEFATHCSEETRVNTVSSQKWATYVQPTPTATATPTPTSSSSSLAANVLLLISLLVFVFQF